MADRLKLESIRANSARLRKEVEAQTIGYIVGALGIVAGLAWNDAVKALIDYIFPAAQNSVKAKFSYAILITIGVVIVTMLLVRKQKKLANEEAKVNAEAVREGANRENA